MAKINVSKILPLYCFIWTIQNTFCLSYDDITVDYLGLYSSYSFDNGTFSTVIPRPNATAPIDVALQMKIYFISDFDAVDGTIGLIGSLKMSWQDSAAFVFAKYVHGENLHVDYRKLWTPVMVLKNSVDSVKRVGNEAYKVRYDTQFGVVTWQPRVIINAACSPDMSYFPFDQQVCSLTFVPWFQDKDTIRLKVQSSEWDTVDYSKNGVWAIEKTESSVSLTGDSYKVDFTITINRAPTYFLVNIVLPILCLSLLSGMVFLLPAASGERIGFCITCFLAFVVLLQTLMRYLPSTSSPMSLLCYYVIIMMMFSGTLGIINILLMRLYLKPETEPMPKWLKHVLELIKCIKCRKLYRRIKRSASKTEKSSNGIANEKTENVTHVKSVKQLEEAIQHKADTEEDQESDFEEMDWNTLGKLFDSFFFLVFIGVQCAVSLFFLVPIAARL